MSPWIWIQENLGPTPPWIRSVSHELKATLPGMSWHAADPCLPWKQQRVCCSPDGDLDILSKQEAFSGLQGGAATEAAADFLWESPSQENILINKTVGNAEKQADLRVKCFLGSSLRSQ